MKNSMLTKLVQQFDPERHRVREDEPGVTRRFEYENDDEHEDEDETSQ
jgi:hypothetical protein